VIKFSDSSECPSVSSVTGDNIQAEQQLEAHLAADNRHMARARQ